MIYHEWIRGAHGRLIMVEKEIGEIWRRGRSKKQKEDEMKSRMVEDGIGNVRRTCGI
jgi:DNA helicase TIP49 (TBP-interacting protein)